MQQDEDFDEESWIGDCSQPAARCTRSWSVDRRENRCKLQTDYAKSMSELKSLAQQAGVSVPLEMSSSEQTMFDELNSLSAKKFAKQYVPEGSGTRAQRCRFPIQAIRQGRRERAA